MNLSKESRKTLDALLNKELMDAQNHTHPEAIDRVKQLNKRMSEKKNVSGGLFVLASVAFFIIAMKAATWYSHKYSEIYTTIEVHRDNGETETYKAKGFIGNENDSIVCFYDAKTGEHIEIRPTQSPGDTWISYKIDKGE